jgi:predicted Zn-dependent protease
MCVMCAVVLFSVSCSSKEISDDGLLVYIKASSFYNEGKFKEAIAFLDDESNHQNHRELKRFVPAMVLRGKANYFLNEFDEAENYLRMALKKRPAQKDASLFLARALQGKGESEAALNVVEDMLGDDPYDVRTLRLAAEITKSDGQSGGATSIAYLNRAAEAVSSAGTESALVLLERSRRSWMNGKSEQALEDIYGAKTLVSKDSAIYMAIDNLEKIIIAGGRKTGGRNE